MIASPSLLFSPPQLYGHFTVGVSALHTGGQRRPPLRYDRNISINFVGEDDSVLPKANGPTESSAPTA